MQKIMDLERLEIALKKRWKYPYSWGRKQNNNEDILTRFIYEIRTFPELEARISSLDSYLQNYALNRWYNFWSSQWIEFIFSTFPNVIANKNFRDKLIDFSIDNISFDHKTTIFPKWFWKDFDYAFTHKSELIQWLYDNQSQEWRKHHENRLFICLYDSQSWEHWKMKAEISIIEKEIKTYIKSFNKENLVKLNFWDWEVLSDIIWITK